MHPGRMWQAINNTLVNPSFCLIYTWDAKYKFNEATRTFTKHNQHQLNEVLKAMHTKNRVILSMPTWAELEMQLDIIILLSFFLILEVHIYIHTCTTVSYFFLEEYTVLHQFHENVGQEDFKFAAINA